MTTAGVFDGVLLNIADKNHGLEGFLDEIFSFLDRRTDFFDSPSQAQQKLATYFNKYEGIHKKRKQEAFDQEQARLSREPAIQEVFDEPEPTPVKTGVASLDSPVTAAIQTTTTSQASPVSTPPTKASNSEQDLIAPNSGNGADYEKYSWTQTLAIVEMSVPLPFNNVRGKECQIKITPDALTISVRGRLIIDEKFSEKVQPEESFWLISDGSAVSITLEKLDKMRWWNKCLQSEVKKLDTSKVMPENSKLGDLDPETRQTVEKMMFEQQQKAMGRPANNEQADILKKLQQAHPELDFSNAKISG